MTRRWLVCWTLVAAATSAGVSAGEAEQAVLAAQDERVAATVAVDLVRLGGMMTDELSYTHSNAAVESRAEFLDALKTGKYRYKSATFEERRVRIYGDTGIISGLCRVQVTAGGRDLDVRLRFTEIYVKQGGAWEMTLWQSTRVPDPAP